MAISQTITALPEAGHRGVDVRTTFVTKQEAFQDALKDVFVTEVNTFKDQINTTQTEINLSETNASDSADASALSATASNNAKLAAEQARDEAVAAVSALPDGTISDSITTLVDTWSSQKISDELDLKADQATTYTKTEVDNSLATKADIGGTYEETVYTLSGTVIDASNGTIQTLDGTASPTLTSSLTSGESIELIVTYNGGTVTLPTATWWGGEPTALGTKDSFEVKNVGGTLYIRHIGTIA